MLAGLRAQQRILKGGENREGVPGRRRVAFAIGVTLDAVVRIVGYVMVLSVHPAIIVAAGTRPL